jgi:hypothetical protein
MCKSPAYRRFLVRMLLPLLLSEITAYSQNPANQNRAAEQTLSLGPYYALVIGNNHYSQFEKLKTAINDATAVAELLENKYGFQVTLLKNATREMIFASLQEYENQLPENSNLLIYYAGHGSHDKDTDVAYWLPVDAGSNRFSWISAADITSSIKAIHSRHVLVISDSCYSGALASGPGISIDREHTYLAKMLVARSRNLMSSGGDEPVIDKGDSGHSVFANALLKGLTEVKEEQFTAGDIFQKFVKQAVADGAAQKPQYSFIDNPGQDSGDFVFSRGAKVIVIKIDPENHPAGNHSPVPSSLPAIACKKDFIGIGLGPKIKAGDLVPCKLLDQSLRWLKEYPLPQLRGGPLTKWTAMLMVTVNEDGRVIDIKPRGRVSPQGMDSTIKAEAQRWQTNPPTYQGMNVKSSFALDIEFGQ